MTFNEGRIEYLHCEECGHNFFYPRDRCPRCHGNRLERRTSSGNGKIFSYTEFQGGIYAIVEMDEGFRLYANVRDKVKIGDRVRAVQGKGRPEFVREP